MTRHLTPDEYRKLPDPKYYEDRREIDLDLADGGYDHVDPDSRHETVQKIEDAAQKVKSALESDNPTAIREATEALQKAWHEEAGKMYAQAQAAGAGEGEPAPPPGAEAGGASEPKGDDGAVDSNRAAGPVGPIWQTDSKRCDRTSGRACRNRQCIDAVAAPGNQMVLESA